VYLLLMLRSMHINNEMFVLYKREDLNFQLQSRVGCAHFAGKNFLLISEIKRIWIRFTSVSLLFFRFFSPIFASNFSLRFALVIFASKRNEIQVFFLVFFAFFRFFHLQFLASLRFSNFCFEAKRGGNFFASKEAKFNIFRIILLPYFVSSEKKNIFIDFFASFSFYSDFFA
jgi:hypothetical protein